MAAKMEMGRDTERPKVNTAGELNSHTNLVS